MSEISRFLVDKFREWEHETGVLQTVTSFAEYLGVQQPSLSRWMSGKLKPDYENAKKIAARLGTEIYDLLDYQQPNEAIEALRPILEQAPELTPEAIEDLKKLVREYLADFQHID